MKPRLQSRIVAARDLTSESKRQMFALFSEYYADVSFDQFLTDLAEKTHVFMVTGANGLAGFSTMFRKRMPDVAPGLFLFSGDTVLHRDYWGSKVFQTTIFRFQVASKLRAPREPVYWMLMSKGFKTYMIMTTNFARAYPSHREETPPALREIKDRFYTAKFGANYSPADHLIRFASPKGAVKGNLADPDPRIRQEPAIRHFLALNPEYRVGTELACIAEVRFADFLVHLRKYFVPKRRSAP